MRGSGLRPPDVSDVAELQRPLTQTINSLSDALLAGKYGVIVADDTSGRVPGVIVRYVVDALRARHGLPKIPMLFLPGGGGRDGLSGMAQKVLDERAAKLVQLADSKRVLLVTDYVQTGATLVAFATGLDALALGVDFLAIGISAKVAGGIPGLPPACRLIHGGVREKPPGIDGDHASAGVNKFFTPRVRRDMNSREHVVASRAEARRVATAIQQEMGL